MRLLSILATASLLSACASPKPRVRDSNERPGTSASVPPVAPKKTRLTLIDPGAEPRQPVTVMVKPNMVYEVELRVDKHEEILHAGKTKDKITMPGVINHIRYQAIRVSPAQFTLAWTLKKRATPSDGMNPHHFESLQAYLAKKPVTKGEITYDQHGRRLSYKTEGDFPEQEALVINLWLAYPDQPIGVGARWKIERESMLEGFDNLKVTTITLSARDGDEITLSGTSEHNVESGPMEMPGLPQGTWVNAKWIRGNETMNAKLKSGSFFPTTMEQEDRLTSLIQVGGNGPAMEYTYLDKIRKTASVKIP